ncbi:transposase [Burkholderia sp. IT-111MI5]
MQIHPSINAHQTLDVIRDRSQTTLVSQSDSIGKPKSRFAAPLDEH